MDGKTYRSVHWLVTFKVFVLLKTMMCLAKGHAGNTACNGAETDRAETAEETVLPRLGCLRRLGVDMFAGTGEDIVETTLPLFEIVMVDGTVVVGVCLSWSWCWCRSSHFEDK